MSTRPGLRFSLRKSTEDPAVSPAARHTDFTSPPSMRSTVPVIQRAAGETFDCGIDRADCRRTRLRDFGRPYP